MKKYFLLAAAALTLAACSSDESDNWNGEIRLSSGLIAQGTRGGTAVQSSQFDKGENIDVYIAENEPTAGAETTYGTNGVTVYTAGGDGTLATTTTQYYPTSGNGVNIYAIYPSGATSTFTVKADQTEEADYKASDLMYGKPASNPVNRTSSAVNIGFTHMLSKVTVNLTAGTGSPSLEGATVEILNVLPTTTLTASAGSGSVSDATGTATAITVFTASATTKSGSCIVPPQTLNQETTATDGITKVRRFIRVTLTDGGVLYSNDIKDGSSNAVTTITMTGGNEYTYDITVNLTELTITSSITPWATSASTGTATME